MATSTDIFKLSDKNQRAHDLTVYLNNYNQEVLETRRKQVAEAEKFAEELLALNNEKNNFKNSMSDIINSTLKLNNTNINKIFGLLIQSVENINKTPEQINTLFVENIWSLIQDGPYKTNLDDLLNKKNVFPSFDNAKKHIEDWTLNQRNTNITSSFYNNKNTIFELDDYFVQIIYKGDSYGKRATWEHDKPGLQFLKKYPNYSLDDFHSKLSTADRHLFFSVINSQVVGGSGSTYFLEDFIKNHHPKEGSIYHLSDTFPDISLNQHFQLVNLLKKLDSQNFNFKQKEYFALNNTPYKEYAINPDKNYMNIEYILNNGYASDEKTGKPIHYDDLLKQGYEIIDPLAMYKRYEGHQNKQTGKWKEISEYKFKQAVRFAFPEQVNSDGFFTTYPNYGDLHEYYQKYNDRYFYSLQRISFDKDYIKQNLESSITRLKPLSENIIEFENHLKEYFPNYYQSFKENGKIERLNLSSYEMLKGAGFNVTNISKTFTDGIDGVEIKDNKYCYDVKNQVSDKFIKNKYDQFAMLFLNKLFSNSNSTLNYIKSELQSFNFKGDIDSLSKNLYENRNVKFINLKTLENILYKNSSEFKIIPPTLQNISSYALSKNISINNFIYHYFNKKSVNNNIDLDLINTSNTEKKHRNI